MTDGSSNFVPSIKLFGSLVINNPSISEKKPLTKPAQALLALLLISPRVHFRSILAQELWPDADSLQALTSLRNAIAQIKSAIGNQAIVADKTTIQINRLAIRCDLWDAIAARDLARITSVDSDRRQKLELLIHLTHLPLAPHLTIDRINQERETWISDRHQTMLQLVETLRKQNHLSEALKIAQNALLIDPLSEPALIAVIELLAETQHSHHVRPTAENIAKQYKAIIQAPLPRSVIDLVAEIQSGAYRPKTNLRSKFTGTGQQLLITAYFEQTLAQNPDLALQILCDQSPSPIAIDHMTDHLALLEIALTETTGTSPQRIRAARMASGYASFSNQPDKAFHWGQFVLDSTKPDDQIHVAVLTFLAIIHLDKRNWTEAEALYKRALATATEKGYIIEELSSQVGLANIKLRQLNNDNILETLYSVKDQLINYENNPERLASVVSNIAVAHLAQSQFVEAKNAAEEAILLATKGGTQNMHSIAKAVAAIASIRLGETRAGLQLAQEALTETFSGNRPLLIIGALEAAGLAISTTPNPTPGLWILEAAQSTREKNGTPRVPLDDYIIQQTVPPGLVNDQTNYINNEPLPTIVEFALQELRYALEEA